MTPLHRIIRQQRLDWLILDMLGLAALLVALAGVVLIAGALL